MDTITKFIEDANIIEILINGAINLVIAALSFLIGKWVAGMVQNALEKVLRLRSVDEVLVDFLGNIVYALVIVVFELLEF